MIFGMVYVLTKVSKMHILDRKKTHYIWYQKKKFL
jgi:hypothetical protein